MIKDSGVNPVSKLDWSAHILAEWVGEAVAWLTTAAAQGHYSDDFALSTKEGA